ncbi:MAG TPA: anti-sigma factor antagonist [Proteobacteria bacterium]|nr:anti-sigma factor antagonist [Pseudomonadota bacterium]
MKVNQQDDQVTILLSGDLTSETLNDLRAILREKIDAGNRSFNIDFKNTLIIDSMGIGCLVATYNTLKINGGSLQLSNVSENLREIFQIMRLDRILTIV